MINLIKKGSNKIGIDGAIGFTLLARIISAGGSLILIALISLFLSKEEQGYYYTFGSILALQVFFELGLNGIITQYVAHETVHLKWVSETELSGSDEHLSRLSSLLHFCLKVFGMLSFVLFLILTVVGYVFFAKYQQGLETIHWQIPWILVSFSTCLMLLVNPILAFFEGLGKVKEVAKIRMMQQSANVLCIALVFIAGGGLYALGIASLLSFLIILGNILFSYRKSLILFIYRARGIWKVDYWKEIFPFQWKIALSWISGYFIFQLFNPVLFATAGAVVAGQMGMTLQALNGISSISMSWISTKIPLFSSLIAEKAYDKLDLIFNKTLAQLSVVNFGLLLIFIFALIGLNYFQIPIYKRFLPLFPLILLCIVLFANQFVFSWATYLRCHKEEPFLINSIVCGILCGLSTFVLGNYFALMGIVMGYTIISLFIGLPWGYLIFRNKKKLWHFKVDE